MKYAICLCLLAATLGAETPERCVTSIGIPAYPRLAEQARIECTVKVGITIDEAGAVVTATGVSGHPILQAAAVENARLGISLRLRGNHLCSSLRMNSELKDKRLRHPYAGQKLS